MPERLPTGEDLVDTAGEESSLAERFRREIYEEGEDVFDVVENNANDAYEFFSPPPTGSHETTPSAGPYFSAQQHPGVDVGTGATALFALGLTIDRVAAWTMRYWEKHGERD